MRKLKLKCEVASGKASIGTRHCRVSSYFFIFSMKNSEVVEIVILGRRKG